jgi:hypothetical protein
MATVNNATGVFATLGYNFDDPNGQITTLSTDAQAHLNSMPPFITTWQAQDIRNNDVGGYYQNPVISQLTNIKNTVLLILQKSGANGLSNIRSSSADFANTANAFIEHTNRLSGVTPFTGSDQVNPYLDQAVIAGKTALYVTNQTDSIKNTAPILGSFTSLMIGPQLQANADVISTYPTEIQAGIDNPYTTNSVLIPSRVQAMNSYIQSANTFLTNRMNSDINYYGNLKTFVDKYNTTKKFTKLGETEQYLYINFIGTDKLKSRIS